MEATDGAERWTLCDRCGEVQRATAGAAAVDCDGCGASIALSERDVAPLVPNPDALPEAERQARLRSQAARPPAAPAFPRSPRGSRRPPDGPNAPRAQKNARPSSCTSPIGARSAAAPIRPLSSA